MSSEIKEPEELDKHFLSVALAFPHSRRYINQGEQEKMNKEFVIYYLVLGGLVALAGLGFVFWAKVQAKKTSNNAL